MYLSQTYCPHHKGNRIAQEHRVGVITQSTLRSAKHFNRAQTITSFTHGHTGIRRWERNEDILTIGVGMAHGGQGRHAFQISNIF